MRSLRLRQLGICDYAEILAAMQAFNSSRDSNSLDELWLLQHPPVFTQGLAGKAEHILNPGSIAVVQADRGGQVTYHGPGQLIVYCLFDVKRAELNLRPLVSALEQSVLDLLADHAIEGYADRAAPGVYVAGRKLASLGLRIRRGCSYHGLSLNVALDLEPFQRINPCGYAGLVMTQLADLGIDLDLATVGAALVAHLTYNLGYSIQETVHQLPALTAQDLPYVSS